MALVLNWQKKLGYHNDPFQDKPFFTECLVGLDKQREAINLFIIKGQQLGLVLGEKGTGKSTLVQWLQEEMQGKIKVIALEAKTIGSKERLEKTLYNTTSNFIEKHLIKDEKTKEEKHTALKERLKAQHVLFIDNAGSLTPPHISLLQEFLNDTKLQLLLFDLPEKFKKQPFSQRPSLRVTLGNYIEDHFLEILRCRIEDAGSLGTFPFDAKERRRLFSKADHNPRALLKFARERAIELSLKGLNLPTNEKGEEKKSGGGFSLFGLRFITKGEAAKLKKIQKSEESVPLFKVVDKEKNKEDKKLEKEERATVSDEAKQQAEELEKMLREAVGEEPKETKVSDGKKPDKHRKKHKDNIHEHIIVSKR